MTMDLVIEVDNEPGALAGSPRRSATPASTSPPRRASGQGDRPELHILVPHAEAARHALALRSLAVAREREVASSRSTTVPACSPTSPARWPPPASTSTSCTSPRGTASCSAPPTWRPCAPSDVSARHGPNGRYDSPRGSTGRRAHRERVATMFFRMSTATLAIVLVAIVGGSAAVGTVIGRRMRARPDASHESVGVVQATLLGLVGLLLAFGLTMAVGRYDTPSRRRRAGGQRHRHDVPARPDAGRARPHELARAPRGATPTSPSSWPTRCPTAIASTRP